MSKDTLILPDGIPAHIKTMLESGFASMSMVDGIPVSEKVEQVKDLAKVLGLDDSVIEKITVGASGEKGNNGESEFELSDNGTLIIPAGIKVIKSSTFEGVSGLRHLVLPDSVERIEEWAFDDTEIESIVLPATLREIEDVGEIKYVDMSRCVHIREILNSRFYNYSGRGGVVYLPPFIERLGDGCFDHIDYLYAPASLKEVGEISSIELFCPSPRLKSLKGLWGCKLHTLPEYEERYKKQMLKEEIGENILEIDSMPYLEFMYEK